MKNLTKCDKNNENNRVLRVSHTTVYAQKRKMNTTTHCAFQYFYSFRPFHAYFFPFFLAVREGDVHSIKT